MEPLPTMVLQVSGKRKIKSSSKTPENMARNQKMDLHPRYLSGEQVSITLKRCYLLNPRYYGKLSKLFVAPRLLQVNVKGEQ